MIDSRDFVAVGLLTRKDLELLGSGFRTAFPVESCPDFDGLLQRIDEAEERSLNMNSSRLRD